MHPDPPRQGTLNTGFRAAEHLAKAEKKTWSPRGAHSGARSGYKAKSKQKTRMRPLLTSQRAQWTHPGSEKPGDSPWGTRLVHDRAASSKPSLHYVRPLVFNLQIPRFFTKA